MKYEGDWGSTEWGQWDRYVRLHAGRSILMNVQTALKKTVIPRGPSMIMLISRRYWAQQLIKDMIDEIECQIENHRRLEL